MSWPASGQLYYHTRWVPGHSGHMPASWRNLNPFPTLLYYSTVGTCEAQTEACMALPGPAKGLAVATVTYINYPSRRKP